MWRFLEGCEPPKKKTKQTHEELLTKQKEYDQNQRKRSFNQKWQDEFKSWLLFDGGKMYCRQCRSAYGKLSAHRLPDRGGFKNHSKGPFVEGTDNFKHSTLTPHDLSEGHKVAVNHMKNRTAVPGNREADQSRQMLNKAVFNKLDKLFRNAHAIAKNKRPFSDFVWMSDLDIKKGVDIGETYRNDKSCKSFITAISEVERQKMCDEVKNNKFITIISDGSTDVSSIENEIIYCRTARLGKSKILFSSLEAVGKADAEGIYYACTTSLTSSFGVESLGKVEAFAADGASVNTGHVGGAIVKFRERLSPSIVMVKCLAHRLELAFQNACKGKVFNSLLRLLTQLYKYYRSPLQRSNLKQMFDSLGLGAVMPLRIGGTRWVSHTLAALQNLWKGYKGYVAHLQQMTDSKHAMKVRALLALLHSKAVIHFGHFLNDLLSTMSRFSRELQHTHSSIYLVHEQLRATQLSLQKLEERPGPLLSAILDAPTFQGEELRGGSFAYPSAVVRNLLVCIDNRYSDVSDKLFSSTKIADLSSWPLEFCGEFGDESVRTLVDHFRRILIAQECDVDQVPGEWDLLKQLLYENDNIFEISWETVNSKYKRKVPNILDVMDLVLSLPASSAECERGFSVMKMTKTDYRNGL